MIFSMGPLEQRTHGVWRGLSHDWTCTSGPAHLGILSSRATAQPQKEQDTGESEPIRRRAARPTPSASSLTTETPFAFSPMVPC
jgi:hypothetical protein